MRLGGMLFALAVVVRTASAADAPPPPPQPAPPAAAVPSAPAKTTTVTQATDEVVAAVRGGDPSVLATLAARSAPDPWRVADELLARGDAAAATAFAAAVRGAAVAALPAYVATRRGVDDAAARRRLEAALAAHDRQAPADTVAALLPDDRAVDTVPGCRCGALLGTALRRLRRHAESHAAFVEAARRGERIGWLRFAAAAFNDAGDSAAEGASFALARGAYREQLRLGVALDDAGAQVDALTDAAMVDHATGASEAAAARLHDALARAERAGDRRRVAIAHGNLALVHRAAGRLAEGRAAIERSLALGRELGDRGLVATGQLNLGAALTDVGEMQAAIEVLRPAQQYFREVGDLSRCARTTLNLGTAQLGAYDFEAAAVSLELARSLATEVGDRVTATAAAAALAGVARDAGDLPGARQRYEAVLPELEAIGDAEGLAKSLDNLGVIEAKLGDLEAALRHHERALALFRSRGDPVQLAIALHNLGLLYEAIEGYPRARAAHEESLRLSEASGSPLSAAVARADLGRVLRHEGDLAGARDHLERAWATFSRLGDDRRAATALLNLGAVLDTAGDVTGALARYDAAIDLARRADDTFLEALVLEGRSVVRLHLGDPDGALVDLRRAAAIRGKAGDPRALAGTLERLGSVHLELGATVDALACVLAALDASEKLADAAGTASALGQLSLVYARLDRLPEAIDAARRGLAVERARGDRVAAAASLLNVGYLLSLAGRIDEAEAARLEALRAAEELGSREVESMALVALAGIALYRGDPGRAAALAERAVSATELLVRGLDEEQGPLARSQFGDAFEAGARAAAALVDPARLAFFLESGRAGALREALRVREALGAFAIPADLRRAEAEARAAEAAAVEALRRAVATNDRPAIVAARRTMEEAWQGVSDAVARIQREAKAGAALAYPRPDPLDTLAGRLEATDALVLYGTHADTALVVTRAAARIVALPPTDEIEAACRALDPSHPDGDPGDAVAALRRAVVDPLALGADVKRVLLSPDGALSYVPFALLMPERTVAYVPSGTTYGLLLADADLRGEGVLALGDPDYAIESARRDGGVVRSGVGGALPRLPGTRAEATAVGRPVLLGGDASERGLREAIAKRPRWRAIHLACHGLIDAERPSFSSLALTTAGDDDGLLTTLEVFRSRFPADLVVLSACETAKGRVMRGEGIVGLTRAFMYAGSPRVICSLWKVNDDATRALMVRFYELWNPRAQPEDPERAKRVEGAPGSGLPAAEALREAQAFVRSHERWKHPYYWAAWALWGLPE